MGEALFDLGVGGDGFEEEAQVEDEEEAEKDAY